MLVVWKERIVAKLPETGSWERTPAGCAAGAASCEFSRTRMIRPSGRKSTQSREQQTTEGVVAQLLVLRAKLPLLDRCINSGHWMNTLGQGVPFLTNKWSERAMVLATRPILFADAGMRGGTLARLEAQQ